MLSSFLPVGSGSLRSQIVRSARLSTSSPCDAMTRSASISSPSPITRYPTASTIGRSIFCIHGSSLSRRQIGGSLVFTAAPDSLTLTDTGEPDGTPSAVRAAEQQHRNGSGASVRHRAFGNPRRALLCFKLDAADFGKARRVEQQNRAAVVGEGGSGIKA